MTNLRSWNVQQLGRNGQWFIRGGDMLETDARYWFAKYAREASMNDRFRLYDGHTLVCGVVNVGNCRFDQETEDVK